MEWRLLALAAFAGFSTFSASAQPALNPNNGHYYARVLTPNGITWAAAYGQAAGMWYNGQFGYLAVITSPAEDAFIRSALGDLTGLWLGAYQPENSPEPSGGWTWITGEQWRYTRWLPGEPNNWLGSEDGLILWNADGGWNDAPRGVSDPATIRGFVVEYGDPGVAFCAANGHYYEVLWGTPGINWTDANAAAQSRSLRGAAGHLVTITSADEQAFLVNAFGDLYGLWFGGYQIPGSGEPMGQWAWVTGEQWAYSNWESGEPNDLRGFNGLNADENRLIGWTAEGHWNDLAAANATPAHARGYVVEYTPCAASTGDANSDGCVDDADITAIILDFGYPPSGANGSTDTNCDGVVDDTDLTVVILNFGDGC